MSSTLEDEEEQDLQQALAATKSAQDALIRRRRSSAAASLASRSLKSTVPSVGISALDGDFDDTDFDVPTVTLPTLEDILAEKDNDDFLADVNAVVAAAASLETTPEARRLDSEVPGTAPATPASKPKSTTVHGSVLRYSRLKNLAAHLHSASSRVQIWVLFSIW